MSAKLKLRADTLSCFFYFLLVGVYYALFTSLVSFSAAD